ncbi:kinase-like domain-containing protein [Blastocladiella britannica]|nr:kinase-like domain-containing protein [Blastocladiella britannica]
MNMASPKLIPSTDIEIQHKVGTGTFGDVRRAINRTTGESLALKRLKLDEADGGGGSGSDARAFPITAIREIKLLKRLEHKNVVKMLDVVVDCSDGSIYMVFPYIEHDLAGLLLNRHVVLDEGQIKSLMRQMFHGINYLHSNNIVHRDLKTANLLVTRAGELKVGDFGLARTLDPRCEERLTPMVVTRWYRPPELLIGFRPPFRYSAAIDIWGAGCIVGEMFTREPIFRGGSDIITLDKIFSVCGTPVASELKGWAEVLEKMSFAEKGRPRNMNLLFAGCDPSNSGAREPLLMDMIDQLLRLDPSRRPSACNVLEHPWFTTVPLPRAGLPSQALLRDSHEMDYRNVSVAHPRPTAVVSNPNLHQSRASDQLQVHDQRRRDPPPARADVYGASRSHDPYASVRAPHQAHRPYAMPPHHQHPHQHQHQHPQQYAAPPASMSAYHHSGQVQQPPPPPPPLLPPPMVVPAQYVSQPSSREHDRERDRPNMMRTHPTSPPRGYPAPPPGYSQPPPPPQPQLNAYYGGAAAAAAAAASGSSSGPARHSLPPRPAERPQVTRPRYSAASGIAGSDPHSAAPGARGSSLDRSRERPWANGTGSSGVMR